MFYFSRQIDEKFWFFPGKLLKNFDFFQAKFSKWPLLVMYSKMSVYPDKICHLKLNSGQIILFRKKSHHFRTYFLYMIRCNNVSRPVHDPQDPLRPPATPRPPAENLGVATPLTPQDWRLCCKEEIWSMYQRSRFNLSFIRDPQNQNSYTFYSNCSMLVVLWWPRRHVMTSILCCASYLGHFLDIL